MSIAQTSMATIRRISMNPMNIENPPIPRRMRPAGNPKRPGGFSNIRIHERWGDDEQEAGQEDRHPSHYVARHPLLRRKGVDLALDADALANGERDRVENLCQVAADLVLDGDRRGHQLEVVRAYASDHVVQGNVEGEAQVDLADHPAKFHGDGRLGFPDDHLDGLQERRSGPQRVGDQGDGVGELLVECLQAGGATAAQPHPRQVEADGCADQEGDRCLERRQHEAQDE